MLAKPACDKTVPEDHWSGLRNLATINDILKNMNTDVARMSQIAALVRISPFAQNSALLGLGKQAAAVAKLMQSQSDDVLKLVADYGKGTQSPTAMVRRIVQQSEAMARLADVARPNAAVVNAIRQSNARLANVSELFHRNVALLQAQSLRLDRLRLVEALPNVRSLVARMEQRDAQGRAVLDETGFEFVYELVGGSFAAGLATMSPQVRGAAMTNKLLSFTKSDEFQSGLLDQWQKTPILQRRWPILAQALQAHGRREYLLAIPVLMSQHEGLIGDALVLKSTVKKTRGKFYELDSTGRLRLDRHNKPVELRGLVSKVERFPLAGHEILQGVVDLIATDLATRRNLILHGSDVDYGQAKVSVQLLLCVYLWGIEIADFVS
jgi:hypothetical protein